jgi:two-component system chemotaxis response regulator CheB
MEQRPLFHDIIVIGASEGGLEPLKRLIGGLPANLPASVFIVLHVGASSHLADILDRAGPLRVKQAQSGEPIKLCRVYVAAPGAHLLVHDSHIMLRRGPRENFARPAIDPLFRSAAATFGSRVIGVVLSGGLNDGTAGLRAIKRCGGIAVIQDPNDATVPDMPESAQRHVDVDHAAEAAGMADLLTRLASEPVGETPEIPMDIRMEAAIAAQEPSSMDSADELGSLSPFSCPECHGTLWEIADDRVLRYRCHAGHACTAEALHSAQAEEIEQMLWALLRSHSERAALASRMAERERKQNRNALAARLQERAREYETDAGLLRRLLHRRNAAPDDQDQASDGQQ